MRTPIGLVLLTVLPLAGCDQSGNSPVSPAAPPAPTALSPAGDPNGASSIASSSADVVLPFHAEVGWNKMQGTNVTLCTASLPEGKVYLMRNTLTGPAVGTHLGAGTFLGNTCVYGTVAGGPEGWLMDVSLTAANGDVLLATAAFQGWTGVPGQSVALEHVTFHGGGSGRFEFAEGSGTCSVNPLSHTATYEGSLRYGRKDK